jgi:shikimate kinase
MVIGCGGSGKSTFAEKLGARLDLPVIVLDQHYRRLGLPEGCRDRFDWAFTRYDWDFQRKRRPRIVSGIERFGAHLRLFRLFSDRDGDELLATIGAA